MIKDIAINKCLISLEGVLKIDYEDERTTHQVLDNAIRDLESTYSITIDKSLYDIQAENQLSATNVERLLSDISLSLQQLSLYILVSFYSKSMPVQLSNVNYLSFSREKLLTALQYLMDKDTYEKQHERLMPPIESALDTVPLNYPKRLFTILLMLDRLGIPEGASIVANLLYMAGRVK